VTHDQHIFELRLAFLGLFQAQQKVLKLPQCSTRRERLRNENLCLVANFGAYKRGCLLRALERTGDDEIKLHFKGIQVAAEKKALLLALFVERTANIHYRIGTARSRACMSKKIKIHRIVLSGAWLRGQRPFNLIVTIGWPVNC